MALTDGLVSYWSFDSNGTDLHGSNDLTLVSSSDIAGHVNNARLFSANTGFANNTSSTGFPTGTGPVSISFWNRSTSWSTAGNWVFALGDNSNANRYVLGFLGGFNPNQIVLYIGDGTGVTNTGNITTSVNSTTWTHFVITRNGTAWQVYENGSLLASGNFSTNRSASTVNRVQIRGNLASGSIPNVAHRYDEFGVWSKVLSSAEVTELYNGGAGLSYDDLGGDASNSLFFGGGL